MTKYLVSGLAFCWSGVTGGLAFCWSSRVLLELPSRVHLLQQCAIGETIVTRCPVGVDGRMVLLLPFQYKAGWIVYVMLGREWYGSREELLVS